MFISTNVFQIRINEWKLDFEGSLNINGDEFYNQNLKFISFKTYLTDKKYPDDVQNLFFKRFHYYLTWLS